ncbi:phosphomannomutase [Vibrio sonorensis]|uniref:phosphomannomutase n=1 Tax=Vibrio sonorensis TaxID=1004316 RepID=UPI0008D91850|nr:phosphomannomutase [Vibrio sonorensis]
MGKINIDTFTNDVIASSGVLFGTSGARGLVEQFTEDACAAFTVSFLKKFKGIGRLAIGVDNRPSSCKMAESCASAASGLGFEIEYFGVLPTPALAHYSMSEAIPAIMVTGSHIPFDRNGLKFYKPDGEISKNDELEILSVHEPLVRIDDFELPTTSTIAIDRYIERYTKPYESSLLKGLKIGIYEHSSSGRDVYSRIFEALGAETVSLGRSDHFVPIDTEAVSPSDNLQAQKWLNHYKLDYVFSTDGDGDRPLLSDETGKYLRGDTLGLLASMALDIEAVVVPVNSNTSIDHIASFSTVEKTKIGSPYVIEGINTLKPVFNSVGGFEANGGYLLGSDLNINGSVISGLPTRDAILPVIAVLANLNGRSIIDLVESLPDRFTSSDRLQNYPTSEGLSLLEKVRKSPEIALKALPNSINGICVNGVDVTDGVRLILNNDEIIHLRTSGNAPELRCYAESNTQEGADSLVLSVLNAIKNNKI